MNLHLFLLLMLSVNISFAQMYSSELWHYGEVMKKDSTVERGKLFYSFVEERVQIQTPNQLKVYHAKDVILFRFTDSLTNKLRVIETKKYQSTNDYVILGFFETLVNVKEPFLLKREYVSRYATTDGLSGFISYQKALDVDYFYTDNNKIHFLPTKSKRFFALFESKQVVMKEYSKNNKLRISKEADVIQLFRHYYKIK